MVNKWDENIHTHTTRKLSHQAPTTVTYRAAMRPHQLPRRVISSTAPRWEQRRFPLHLTTPQITRPTSEMREAVAAGLLACSGAVRAAANLGTEKAGGVSRVASQQPVCLSYFVRGNGGDALCFLVHRANWTAFLRKHRCLYADANAQTT